ncbi:MAG: hypothetical protein OXG55_12070 [bacterium]|nr:hypothetical protein [bacterium]
MNVPRLSGPPLALPASRGPAGEIWTTLCELAAAKPDGWTLIGGQMVLLHALERDAEPTRTSTDLDILVNARIVVGAVGAFVSLIETLGFTIASPDHAVWTDFAGPAAARARLALRTLLPGASPAASPTT